MGYLIYINSKDEIRHIIDGIIIGVKYFIPFWVLVYFLLKFYNYNT